MWQNIARVSDLEEGKPQQFQVESRQIALFKTGGEFYAIDGFCPHRGGPLGQGHLDGLTVTCPWHAWTFNIKTGECHNLPDGKRNCFPVKTEGDSVWIDV